MSRVSWRDETCMPAFSESRVSLRALVHSLKHAARGFVFSKEALFGLQVCPDGNLHDKNIGQRPIRYIAL